jgi:outer membrane biosynthesis protein TonB
MRSLAASLAAILFEAVMFAAAAQAQSVASDTGTGIPFCNAAGISKPAMQTKMSLEDSYPPLSVVLGEEGSTVVGFTILKNGTVADVHVEASSGSLRLDSASVNNMR